MYDGVNEVFMMGNLNGLWGYGSDLFGVALGEYNSGLPWISVDSTNGIRIMSYTTQVAGLSTSSTEFRFYDDIRVDGEIYIDSGTYRLRRNGSHIEWYNGASWVQLD